MNDDLETLRNRVIELAKMAEEAGQLLPHQLAVANQIWLFNAQLAVMILDRFDTEAKARNKLMAVAFEVEESHKPSPVVPVAKIPAPAAGKKKAKA